tara:strand:- start:418 stop:621 length:204 start_codon:yes stop_codon:yes gene_type:complete
MTTSQLQDSGELRTLCEELTNSIVAYSQKCHMVRQHLVHEFGYTIKEANEFMNDIVRGAYRYPQDKS